MALLDIQTDTGTDEGGEVGMTIKEIIEDLELSNKYEVNGYSIRHYGSFIHGISQETLDAIIPILKAQEPRVMTLGEISSISGGDIVWIEDRSLDQMIAGIKFQSPSKNCYYVMLIGSTRPQPFSKELYEVNWRCWTSRPTDEQREKEHWNG